MNALLLLIALRATTFANPTTTPTLAPADSVTHKLTVDVSNIKDRRGMIYVAIMDEEAAKTGGSYRKTRVAVPTTGEVKLVFDELPVGQYAIRLYQDLNENQRLDFTGPIPKEPFGFSNGVGFMGSFSFKKNSFAVDAAKTITISLVDL